MKNDSKIGLYSKFFIVSFFTIPLCILIMLVIVTYHLQKTSIQEVYYRLTSYCDVTAYDWQVGNRIEPQNLNHYGIVQGKFNNGNYEIIYDNSTMMLKPNESEKLMEVAQIGYHTFITDNGDSYFYIFQVYEPTDYFVLMFVDDDYSQKFSQKLIASIIAMFLATTFVLFLGLGYFMTRIVTRINRLNSHISSLSRNNYHDSYVDSVTNDEIGQLSQSVEEMRQEIETAENTKQEMLQNISHDLKTPIAVIKNYAESIQDGFDTEKSSGIIIKQADILLSKVNQLLQYNRLEYLSQDREFERVNLKDVCQDVINNMSQNSKLEFVSHLDDCYLDGYRENYVTIISNIIDNAMRYANTKICVTTKQDKITIYNDGPEIEEQFINQTFKPYEKGSKGQFGLGMSIVQKTVNFFGLKLKVYNETYGGVSFVIYKDK